MRADHRTAALRAKMRADGFAAVAVIDSINIAYLTGFEGVFDEERAHIAVITNDRVALYTDNRYSEAAAREASGSEWDVIAGPPDLVIAACDGLIGAGVSAMALEDTVTQRVFEKFKESFKGEVSASRDLVETLRTVKEPEEVARIAEAQALTDSAFDHILGVIEPGLTEREIALELEFFMRKAGSDGVAFPPIVASGPNSSLPHARVTDRRIAAGEFLKMDFGARVKGYCADMTRTVVIGSASDRQREMYDAVLAANAAGAAAVSAGRGGREIDDAARSVLTERGLASLFTHGLGHGVGMEVHELPGVGPRSEGPVPKGAVITIEPGVYEPGYGGVRIEDLVVVEADGARVLTRSPKHLIEL